MINVSFNLNYVDVIVNTDKPLIPNEPDDFLSDYYIQAMHPKDIDDIGKKDNWETITVAHASIVLINPDVEGISLIDACEAHSEEVWQLYQVLFDEDENLIRPPLDSMISQYIWYIERLVVEPEYRNNGLGSAVIDWVIEYLCRGQGAILLQPQAIEIEHSDDGPISFKIDHSCSPEQIVRLKRFYERQGFFELWASPYMYRVLEWKKGVRAL